MSEIRNPDIGMKINTKIESLGLIKNIDTIAKIIERGSLTINSRIDKNECCSEKIIIDKKEIEDFGWFNMNDFDSLRWISEAMKEIAAEAIIGRSRKLIDYSEERGSDYLLYL